MAGSSLKGVSASGGEPRRNLLLLTLLLAMAGVGGLAGHRLATPSDTVPELPPPLRFRCSDPPPARPPSPLPPSVPQVRTLPPGEVHHHPLPLRRGQGVRVVVEQHDLDVEVRLCDPRGRGLVRVDEPWGDRSAEELLYRTSRTGVHHLEVAPSPAAVPVREPADPQAGTAGAYRLWVLPEPSPANGVGPVVPVGNGWGRRRWARAEATLAHQRGEMARRAHLWEAAGTYHRFARIRFSDLGDEAREALSRRRLSAVCRARGDFPCAVREARLALALGLSVYHRGDGPHLALAAAADLGYARRLAGDLDGAEEAYRLSARLALDGGNRRQRANALHNLGRLAARRGRPDWALAGLRAAAVLWWRDGAWEELALARLGLGDLYLSLGAQERARRLYRSAAAAAARVGEGSPSLEARQAEARGWWTAGAEDAGGETGVESEGRPGARGAGDGPRSASVGLDALEEAFRLAHRHGLRRTAFVALDDRARVASWSWPAGDAGSGGIGSGGGRRAGTPDPATPSEAAAWMAWWQARSLGRGAGEAAALAATRGRLHLRGGRPGEAVPDLHRAAEGARRTGEAALEAALRDRLARARWEASKNLLAPGSPIPPPAPTGDPLATPATPPPGHPGSLAVSARPAVAEVIRAADLLEHLRSRLPRPDLRWQLLADRRPTLSLWISLLLEGTAVRAAGDRDTGEGASPASAASGERGGTVAADSSREAADQRLAASFEAAERGRTRGLLDELARGVGGVVPATGSLASLDHRIRALHRQLTREPRGRPGVPSRAAARERRLDDLLWRWQGGLAARRGPPPAVLPYDLGTIQRDLLGDGEALLAYWLGPDGSHLWWLERHHLEVHHLPPRHLLERRAARLRDVLASGPALLGPEQVEADARALGRELLGPVAARLVPGLELLVVPDGALQAVPFALLPLPHRPSRRLVEEHPVTLLPSASVGLLLHRRSLQARGERRAVLALMDGVYEAHDPRLPEEARDRARAAADRPPLPRLPATVREGEVLRRLAGAAGLGPVRVRSGFEATAEVLRQASGLRILHLAAHARPDPRRPELSGLVLSRFDAAGRPVDGFVPAYALAAGDLRCDLAVLSACSTAVGEAVPGEGVLGLARAFLVAGADRVLVSLWDVDDEATAELMVHLYRALLEEGLPPAPALAHAQVRLSEDPRWRDPFHWAGFVLVGTHR